MWKFIKCFNKDSFSLLIFFTILVQNMVIYLALEKNLGSFLGTHSGWTLSKQTWIHPWSHGLLTKPSCSTSKYDTNTFAASGIRLKIKIMRFPDLISFVIVYLSINILWASFPQFFHMFSFWHLILMNKTLGQHHMVFWQNHLAILPNMLQMLLQLLV